MTVLDKKNIEDIFALTPIQEGMLFHYLKDPDSDAYFEQLTLNISGEIEVKTFEKAWNFVVETNEMLRAVFRWEKVENPVQIILKEHKLQVRYYDIPGKDHSEKEEQLEEIKKKDREEKFNLREVPFRVTLGKIEEEKYMVIISNHHILYDGWSNGIILQEFFNAYNDLSVGNQLEKPVKTKFKEFVKCIQDQDIHKHKEENYWRNYLKSGTGKTTLPFKKNISEKTGKPNALPGNLRMTLSAVVKNKLEHFVEENKISLASLFYTSWAILLQQYNNCKDVVFGTPFSGRSAKVNGIENMVGLFINTLPLRIRSPGEQSVLELLQEVNRSLQIQEEYEYSSLVDIKKYSGIGSKDNLFDSILTIESYPILSHLTDVNTSLSIKSYSIFEFTNYDLLLTISTFNYMELNLAYDKRVFSRESVERILQVFEQVIGVLVNHPHMMANEIDILTEREKEDVLYQVKKNTFTLTVTATFTPDPSTDYITWWARRFGMEVDIQLAPYNQVFQELLGKNSLISTNRGMNLLLIRFEDWIRDKTSSDDSSLIKDLEQNFAKLTQIFISKKKMSPYLVGLFPTATHLDFSHKLIHYIDSLKLRWQMLLEGESTDNVYVVDFADAAELYGVNRGEIFDPVTDREGHLPFSDEFYAVMGTTIARKLAALNKPPFKVIVLDLDNTLWEGIVGEDGPLGVKIQGPYLELQKLMLQKYNEGFLLALCSKNNEQDAWEAFKKNPCMLLKKEHFVSWRINWEPKSKNIKELANELNLGLASFIFVDDSPLECAEVMTHCPEVLTLQLPENPENIPHYLKHVWAFDKIKVTNEDRSRTQMYLAEKKRKKSEKESPNLKDFLADLRLKISMNIMKTSQLSRVSQLTQRTNQFNLSTLRRKEDEIANLVKEPQVKCWVLDVSDRFGDYGLVGVVITKEKENSLFIDTLLLSCRVLGRGVEDAILAGLKKYCQQRSLITLTADYYPTARNKPVLGFLERAWSKKEEREAYVTYELNIETIPEPVEFIDFYYRENFKKEPPRETVEKKTANVLLDHIAVAVTDIERAVSYYQHIGYNCGSIVYDPLQRSNLVMCHRSGFDSIELAAAAHSDSPTKRITSKNGDTPYHLCYRVKEIEAFLKTLGKNEIPYESVTDPKPAKLFDYKKVKFIRVKDVGLVELLEDNGEGLKQRQEQYPKKNAVRIVVSHPQPSISFYKHLGYIPGKNINRPGELEITLVKPGTGNIQLVVPKKETAPGMEFLKRNGPHLYQVCFYEEKPLESTAKADEMKPVDNKYICYRQLSNQPHVYRYQWEVKTVNTHNLLHKNQLLPLENYTAKRLLGLPTVRVNIDEDMAARPEYAAPRNEIETKLIDIWQNLLKVERIGIDDVFFNLGGHSLTATRLLSKIHKESGVQLTLNDIFDNPTVRKLAERLRGSEKSRYSTMETVEKKEFYKLSSPQRRLYVLQQLNVENTIYNEPFVIRIKGNLAVGKLEDTFKQLIKRHESFRTSFEKIDGEPVQRIHHEVNFKIENFVFIHTPIDTKGKFAGGKNKTMASPLTIEEMIQNFIRPFDLTQTPLMRVGLIKLEPGHHILVVDINHIITDGISQSILVEDFLKLYKGEELHDLKIQYKDFSQWQINLMQSKELKKQEEYWLKQFENGIPELKLPTDYPIPAVQSFKGSKVEFVLGREEVTQLRELASKKETTLYMILVTVFYILFSKLSGQEDIILGTLIEGRWHEELRHVIGMFVNNLPIRNYPVGEKTFAGFLGEVKVKILEVFKNRDYQFEYLVDKLKVNREANRNPLFNVLFQLDNIKFPGVDIPGLRVTPFEYETRVAKFDIRIQAIELENSLSFAVEYFIELFNRETIERFTGYFKEILECVVKNNDIKLKDITISHDLHDSEAELKREDYSDFKF